MYPRSYSPSFSRQRDQPMVPRSPQPMFQRPPSPLKRLPRIIDTHEDFNPFPFLRDQYPDRDLLTDHPSRPRRDPSSEESGNEGIEASGDLMDFDEEVDESFSPISGSVVRASILNAKRQAEEDEEDNGLDLYEESDDFCSTKPSSDKIVQDAESPDTPPIHKGEMVSSSESTVEQNVRHVSSPLSRLPDDFERGNIEATIIMGLDAPSSNDGDGQADQDASDAAAEETLKWRESLSEKDWVYAAPTHEQRTKKVSENASEETRSECSAEDGKDAEYQKATSSDEKAQLGSTSSSEEDWAGVKAAFGKPAHAEQQLFQREEGDNGSIQDSDVDDIVLPEGFNLGAVKAHSEGWGSGAKSDSSSDMEHDCEYLDLTIELEPRNFDPVYHEWIKLPQDDIQKKKRLLDMFFAWTELQFPTTLDLSDCNIFSDYPRDITDVTPNFLAGVGIHYASWIRHFTRSETASLFDAQGNKLHTEMRARTKTVIEEWCLTAGFPKLPESKHEAEQQMSRPGATGIRRVSTMLLLSPQTRKSERWIRFITKLDPKTKLTTQHYDLYVPNICKLVEEFYSDTSCTMYSFAEEFQDINDVNKTLRDLVEKELTCSLERLKL